MPPQLSQKRIEVRFAGVGGQGIASIGNILGTAATLEGKFVACSYSYGLGTRGGGSSSEVVISGSEIDYPYVTNPDVLIVLSEKVLSGTLREFRNGGLLIADSSIRIGDLHRNDRCAAVPAIKIADDLGKRILTGTVALGALVKRSGVTSKNAMIESIKATFPERLVEENVSAFVAGMDGVEAEEVRM